MTMTDNIGDMLTRIRNAQKAHHDTVYAPASNMKENVLKVLKEEGFISDYKRIPNDGKPQLEIALKYFEERPVIKEIKRISTPGRRVYTKITDLKSVYNGLGISILSTPKGIMSDSRARENNVGGEILCQVF